MFIKENDTVEVTVYCKKNNKNRYAAYTEKEYNDLKETAKKGCHPFVITMKELTWGLYNQLQDEAMISNAEGDSRFNYRIYKETKLKKLIKGWDAKDENGAAIPVNDNMIVHLSPLVAECILKAYDEVSSLSEDEQGK